MAEAATADETAVKASGVRLRRATAADLDAIAALEALAFPPTEAAPRTAYADRLATYPEHILLAVAEDGAVDAEGVAGTEKPAGTGTCSPSSSRSRRTGATSPTTCSPTPRSTIPTATG